MFCVGEGDTHEAAAASSKQALPGCSKFVNRECDLYATFSLDFIVKTRNFPG